MWVDIDVAANLIEVHVDELRQAIETPSDEYPRAYKRAGRWKYHLQDLNVYRDAWE